MRRHSQRQQSIWRKRVPKSSAFCFSDSAACAVSFAYSHTFPVSNTYAGSAQQYRH